MRKNGPDTHFQSVDTLAEWNSFVPGEKTALGNTEVEVAGLVIGPTGVYMLLTADTPFPEGWKFQLDWTGKTMTGIVDYCELKDDKYLMGIEIRCETEPALLAT